MAYSAGDVPSVQLYSGVESQMCPNRCQEASATALDWYKDDLIEFDLTGSTQYVCIADVADSDLTIGGIAMAACAGVTGTKLDVALLDIGAIYKMYMDSSSPAAPGLVGHGYDLVYTKGEQRVTDATHTANEVNIVGINEDDYATSEGVVYVRFSYYCFEGV